MGGRGEMNSEMGVKRFGQLDAWIRACEIRIA